MRRQSEVGGGPSAVGGRQSAGGSRQSAGGSRRTAHGEPIGDTRAFVLPLRWERDEGAGMDALVARDGSRRYFFEVEADPDDPRARVEEAYGTLLAALPHGAGVRLLEVVSADPADRAEFVRRVEERWPQATHPERERMKAALLDFLSSTPLPFRRRVILEFLFPPGVAAASEFLMGVPGLLAGYGVTARPLGRVEVETLARMLFHPDV